MSAIRKLTVLSFMAAIVCGCSGGSEKMASVDRGAPEQPTADLKTQTAADPELAPRQPKLDIPRPSPIVKRVPLEKRVPLAESMPGNDFEVAQPAMAVRSAPDVSGPETSFSKPVRVDRSARFKRSSRNRMGVMGPAEVETDLPPSQTTLTVFYATDRKSKYGIAAGDWLRVHLNALIALGFYVMVFVGVFVSQRKVICGLLALASLVIFLVLGQSASVTWQKQKRLAENGDASYISEIRELKSEGPLDYGTCKVTIPPNHKVGHLDSPSLFKLEFREDPEKHVVLHRVLSREQDEFYSELNNAIKTSDRDQALVFVHGYNVSFENAVKRTAQIVHDLKFDGAPICYSWTSHGALADYTRDMANADATVIALQSFLEETVRRTGKTTIHLVAHSMGNRALLQALDRIAVGSTRVNQKMFGQLVMAAPDVSENDFRNRFVPSAMQLAESVTLYASSRDRALIASTEIHGHNRAGLAGENLIVIDGMDTIDVSEIDTSLIGHSYYGDHPELIRDLRALVELAQPAAERSWLEQIVGPQSMGYFRFAERVTQSPGESQRRRR